MWEILIKYTPTFIRVIVFCRSPKQKMSTVWRRFFPHNRAREIHALLRALDKPVFYHTQSGSNELQEVRRLLWEAQFKLRRLSNEALVLKGVDNRKTHAAMKLVVATHDLDEALDLLRRAVANPNTHGEVRRIAEAYIEMLDPPKKSARRAKKKTAAAKSAGRRRG